MIPKTFLEQRRSAGLSDISGDILAEWQALESQASAWPNASQVAAMFGRSREAVRLWCKHGLFERAGMIGALKLDGMWRINPDALIGFIPPVEGAGSGRKKR